MQLFRSTVSSILRHIKQVNNINISVSRNQEAFQQEEEEIQYYVS